METARREGIARTETRTYRTRKDGPETAMVWSHDDFIRELSRQLVELETLRKKLEGPGDPGEIIERIEESNLHLLKKMHEFFNCHIEVKICGAFTGEPQDEFPSDAQPEYLMACLQSMLQQPGVLKHLTSFSVEPHVEQVTDWNSLALAEGLIDPGHNDSLLQARCGTCEKLIVSAVLGGGQIVKVGACWHHRDCLQTVEDSSELLWQPSVLN